MIAFPCFGNTELLVIPYHRLDLLPDRGYEVVYSFFRVRIMDVDADGVRISLILIIEATRTSSYL